MKPAKRLRIFVDEYERHRGRPLFEALVLAARERGLAGATVFKGFMGYAPNEDIATAEIERLAGNLPVVVEIVDEEASFQSFMPFLHGALKTGFAISSDVLAHQILPGSPGSANREEPGLLPGGVSLPPVARTRVHLKDSASFEGRPAHEAISAAFREHGLRDLSTHHGIMGFDRSSGVLSHRPLRFHADLPVVVEAVGEGEATRGALPAVAAILSRGLITLSGVKFVPPRASRPPRR